MTHMLLMSHAQHSNWTVIKRVTLLMSHAQHGNLHFKITVTQRTEDIRLDGTFLVFQAMRT